LAIERTTPDFSLTSNAIDVKRVNQGVHSVKKLRFVYGSLASLCALFLYNGTAHASVVDTHSHSKNATHSVNAEGPDIPIGTGSSDGTNWP
jgi:hypothetical protein